MWLRNWCPKGANTLLLHIKLLSEKTGSGFGNCLWFIDKQNKSVKFCASDVSNLFFNFLFQNFKIKLSNIIGTKRIQTFLMKINC